MCDQKIIWNYFFSYTNIGILPIIIYHNELLALLKIFGIIWLYKFVIYMQITCKWLCKKKKKHTFTNNYETYDNVWHHWVVVLCKVTFFLLFGRTRTLFEVIFSYAMIYI